jgi:hypothetical protein
MAGKTSKASTPRPGTGLKAGHEAFAQGYASNGGNAAEAYRKAYPRCKSAHAAETNGSLLLRNTEVSGRIAELQGEAAARNAITLDGLIQEADAIQKQAVLNNQMSAAISALIAKAKLAGFWVDRSEAQNTNVSYFISDEPIDEKEWIKRHVRKH